MIAEDSVRQRRRTGIAVLWALVVLSILSVSASSIAWHFVAARRAAVARESRLQARWLARSGAELAASGLLTDADTYTGEVVELIPEGTVRITIEKDATQPDVYRIASEVRYHEGARDTVGLKLTWTATRQSAPARVKLVLNETDSQ